MTLNTLFGLPIATKPLTLIEKLACFDSAVHGGEIMMDAPVGNEFDAAYACGSKALFQAALAEVPHGDISAADRL